MRQLVVGGWSIVKLSRLLCASAARGGRGGREGGGGSPFPHTRGIVTNVPQLVKKA